MRCTFLGHAGWFIETFDAKILCDPWHSDHPRFFDSWSVYPFNDHLNWKLLLEEATILYVSHAHRDHLDDELLATMRKDIQVLLPRNCFPKLRKDLEALGFSNFVDAEIQIGSTKLYTYVSEMPNREMEDSMLLVDDGNTVVVNGNDCKLDAVIEEDITKKYPRGIDIYMGQFSGAAWHPMSYAGKGTFTDERVVKLCRAHAEKTRDRFLRVCRSLQARKWVPCSGPACFLHEDLFHLNAVDAKTQDHCIFPDAYQAGFPADRRLCRVMPGTTFTKRSLRDTPKDPIGDKLKYLSDRRHQTRHAVSVPDLQLAIQRFEDHMASLLREFGGFLHSKIPLRMFVQIGNSHVFELQFECGRISIVEEVDRTPPFYAMTIPPWIFEEMVRRDIWDWEEAFLGQRCQFERAPDCYNPWILAFFKNLERHRMQIMVRFGDASCGSAETFCRDGFEIPRFCPHQGVDLSKHSTIEDGIITCLGHGMKWNLETGQGVNNSLCLWKTDPAAPSCECDIDD